MKQLLVKVNMLDIKSVAKGFASQDLRYAHHLHIFLSIKFQDISLHKQMLITELRLMHPVLGFWTVVLLA